jgi:hypothetical protein
MDAAQRWLEGEPLEPGDVVVIHEGEGEHVLADDEPCWCNPDGETDDG